MNKAEAIKKAVIIINNKEEDIVKKSSGPLLPIISLIINQIGIYILTHNEFPSSEQICETMMNILKFTALDEPTYQLTIKKVNVWFSDAVEIVIKWFNWIEENSNIKDDEMFNYLNEMIIIKEKEVLNRIHQMCFENS